MDQPQLVQPQKLTLAELPTEVIGNYILPFITFTNRTPALTLQALADNESLQNLHAVFSRDIPPNFAWDRAQSIELQVVPHDKIRQVFHNTPMPTLENLTLHFLGEGRTSFVPVDEPIATMRFWTGLARNVLFGREEVLKLGPLRFGRCAR